MDAIAQAEVGLELPEMLTLSAPEPRTPRVLIEHRAGWSPRIILGSEVTPWVGVDLAALLTWSGSYTLQVYVTLPANLFDREDFVVMIGPTILNVLRASEECRSFGSWISGKAKYVPGSKVLAQACADALANLARTGGQVKHYSAQAPV